jgi:hypothetical protein
LEVIKYLVGILVKRLAGMPAKRLANIPAKRLVNRLLALEETRDIIGLVVPSIAVAILPRPANPLDNIKSRNIPLINLGILAKYIYNTFIIFAAYSI